MIFTINNKKILFIHIPKTGGTSIETYFSKLMNINLKWPNLYENILWGKKNEKEYQHLTMKEIFGDLKLYKLSDFDFIFTVVRNPIYRFKSLCDWRGIEKYKIILNKIKQNDSYCHYLKQIDYIDGYCEYVHIYKYEDTIDYIIKDIINKNNLNINIKEIPFIRNPNKKNINKNKLVLNDFIINKIIKIMKFDFMHFDYNICKRYYKKNIEKMMLKNININNSNYTIGIFSIFVGNYSIFFNDFIESINKYFFPKIKKKYFIVTNKELKINNNNIYIIKISDKFIQFPYPTLFRFKYFKQIPHNEFKNINYMFFLNGNSIIKDIITIDDLPINKFKYIFTIHDGYFQDKYKNIPYEKNNISTACITDENHDIYVGGRFFGATLNKFINLCNILYNNILIDFLNNYISIWHDESHLNNFFYNIKNELYYLASIRYHISEQLYNKIKQFRELEKTNESVLNNSYIFRHRNIISKIIYLDKKQYIKSYPKTWNEKKDKYCYNANNKINNELILYYK
jgi:hypothetical protein